MNYPGIIETYLYQISGKYTPNNVYSIYQQHKLINKNNTDITPNQNTLSQLERLHVYDDISLRLLLMPSHHMKLVMDFDIRNIENFRNRTNPASITEMTTKALENFYSTTALKILETRLTGLVNRKFSTPTNKTQDLINFIIQTLRL